MVENKTQAAPKERKGYTGEEVTTDPPQGGDKPSISPSSKKRTD